ncbi:MAG: SHOCT domain-containing protein [Solirubrobacteraceae bacterium]
MLDERENRNRLKLQKAQELQGQAKPSSRRASQTVADKIRQLGELRDQGLITQAEFESKNAEFLRRM